MTDKPNLVEMLELTTEIVAAHVGNNSIGVNELPKLIQDVYQTLSTVGTAPTEPEKPKPAVAIKKSVFPDYIICLENGKKLKMLKRHLKTAHNLTPEEYREKWGAAGRLPDGRTQLRQSAQQSCQGNRTGNQGASSHRKIGARDGLRKRRTRHGGTVADRTVVH